jgi:arylsulfatase A-like enzyme
LSNTLVIITADHGEEFGEHRWVGHGNGLNLPALHVPLLIAFPGRIGGGIRVAETVTLRDVPSTVVDLLGIGAAQMPGRSLVVHWGSAPAVAREPPSPVLSEVNRPRRTAPWYAVAKGRMRSVIVGNHRYILNGDGREEIYDIVADPWETTDLAKSDGSQAILDAARKELASALGTGVR